MMGVAPAPTRLRCRLPVQGNIEAEQEAARKKAEQEAEEAAERERQQVRCMLGTYKSKRVLWASRNTGWAVLFVRQSRAAARGGWLSRRSFSSSAPSRHVLPVQ